MNVSVNPFSHLRSQVKSCLEREAKLTPNERRMYQWQFFATINEVSYVVGKGGANTMFYSVGNSERKICAPKEMLEIISSWSTSKYASYAIGLKPGKYSHGPYQELDSALAVDDAKPGSYIVGLKSDGKVIRLYKLKSGLMEDTWVPFKPKKKK